MEHTSLHHGLRIMSRDHQDTPCIGTSDLVRWRIYWHPPKRMCRIRRCFGPKRGRQADVLVSGVYWRALRFGTVFFLVRRCSGAQARFSVHRWGRRQDRRCPRSGLRGGSASPPKRHSQMRMLLRAKKHQCPAQAPNAWAKMHRNVRRARRTLIPRGSPLSHALAPLMTQSSFAS